MSTKCKSENPCGDRDLSARRPSNRPGLDEIEYRIARHPDYLARMLNEIPRETVKDQTTSVTSRPLENLSARTTEDPTVALMDAWASTLDVLSFYQERIANEGYLRTSNERTSAVELARTIGYELNPGVAASGWLAFDVEDSDDPFRKVTVPLGTQVMSVPKKSGEAPQVFETTSPITARAEWNEIPARTEREQNLALYDKTGDTKHGTLYLLDLDNSFDLSGADPGDVVSINETNVSHFFPVSTGLDLEEVLDDLEEVLDDLEEDMKLNSEIEVVIKGIAVDHVHLRGTGLGLSPGDRMLLVAVRETTSGGKEVRTVVYRIDESEDVTAHGMTRVELRAVTASPRPRRRLKLRYRPAKLRIGRVVTARVPFNTQVVGRMVRRTTWSGAALSAFVRTQTWPRIKLMQLVRQPPALTSSTVGSVEPGLHVMRKSAGFFGHAAPKWENLPKYKDTRGSTKTGNPPKPVAADPYAKPWEPSGTPRTIWVTSQGDPNTGAGADVFLEREIEEIVPGGWVVFETPAGVHVSLLVGAAATQSRSDFALSGKSTGLTLRTVDDQDFSAFSSGTTVKSALVPFDFRSATAHVASEPVALAGLPIEDDVAAGETEVMLDSLYLDLVPGQAISVAGERADAAGVDEAEALVVKDVVHTGGYTRLQLKAGTAHTYRRTSVRVNANVAPATHGEREDEILGSGDATLTNQAFALSKPPLTFVTAATESGSEDTLTIRVDGVEWREVDSLFDAGAEDEVYMIRIDDDGTTRVVFGDGVHGRRLPTGSSNVTASYRSGMGTAGEVDEETLIQLKTRPLGVRGVSNPSAANGAAAAETLAKARVRAPQSVKTLGRIVSLTDYEDFARAFAGVGKARVAAIWRGHERIVHVTVAPATDSVFTSSSTTLTNLRTAMDRLRDLGPTLIVAAHQRRLFQISAKLFYAPRHTEKSVEAAARSQLSTVFGYTARSLAQPVSAATVIATLQAVTGVDHVDLDSLEPYTDDLVATATNNGTVPAVLPALPARLDETSDPPEVLAAELLTLLPSAVTLTLEKAGA